MIVLASTSPRRKEILSKYFTDFICESPLINEDDFMCKNISDYALNLSKMKAYSVFKKHPEDVIIACDTIVVYDNRVFEKPKNHEDAYKMLRVLSGKRHFVLSAYTILYKDFEINQTVKTYVYFKDLSKDQIKNWLNKNTYLDKAGAYAIQENECGFVDKIEGSYNNVVGFPIENILKNLAKLNYFPNKEL